MTDFMDPAFKLALQISREDPLSTDSRDWPEARIYLYEKCDYNGWAEICRRAADMATDPALKTMCQIEVANALRRTGDPEKELEALTYLGLADSTMAQVPAGHPRLNRLRELHIYHSSMLNHMVGNYADAAKEYKRQIQYGIGNTNFALYMAHYEAMHDALLRRETDLILANFDLFEQVAIEFDHSLGSGADDIRWRANIACHRLFFRWLKRVLFIATPVEQIDTDLMTLVASLPCDLKPSFADALAAMEVIRLYNEQLWHANVPTPPSVNMNGVQDWAAAALFVGYHFCLKINDIEEARNHMNHLNSLKGGHSIRALASRPLLLPHS